jgi:hypothetical protein
MLEKPISEIRESDIRSLIANARREDQRIDYKEALPTGGEPLEKFLKHVAGFANTTGGNIVIGIQEKRDVKGKATGEPETIVGLGETNLDIECQRIMNSVRDSISPRIIPTPEIGVVVTGEGPVVLLRVQSSFIKPHMYRHQFYARQGAQTVPLEVEQVRSEFIDSDALPRRMGEFRADRLAQILSGETGVPLSPPPNMVVHVCPFEAFTTNRRVSIVEISNKHLPHPGAAGATSRRLTFSGAMSVYGSPSNARSFLLVHRNGCLEFATNEVVTPAPESGKFALLQIRRIAKLLAIDVPSTIKGMGQGVITYPATIMVTLLGTYGTRSALDQFGLDYSKTIMDGGALQQELVLHEEPKDWGAAMRDVLDSIWQAVGRDHCDLYDSHGQFRL